MQGFAGLHDFVVIVFSCILECQVSHDPRLLTNYDSGSDEEVKKLHRSCGNFTITEGILISIDG